uniref:Uncharacterized protein n=1 Tax=Nonomuraea gerenzanensis TaxID=93944 RepID=A0A1M4ECJ7_9ACTN|nr:hypothetical protein BN4615_P6095 [Nonomuraea gerenzanensis]
MNVAAHEGRGFGRQRRPGQQHPGDGALTQRGVPRQATGVVAGVRGVRDEGRGARRGRRGRER